MTIFHIIIMITINAIYLFDDRDDFIFRTPCIYKKKAINAMQEQL